MSYEVNTRVFVKSEKDNGTIIESTNESYVVKLDAGFTVHASDEGLLPLKKYTVTASVIRQMEVEVEALDEADALVIGKFMADSNQMPVVKSKFEMGEATELPIEEKPAMRM